MMYLFATKVLSGAGSQSMYIPVPRRGIVKGMTVASNATMVATGKLVAYRGATAVNTATAPTGDTAAGTVLVGVPTSGANKDLIFDPGSSTVVNKVIKITDDATLLGGAGTVAVMIKYDDSAAVKQEASEA